MNVALQELSENYFVSVKSAPLQRGILWVNTISSLKYEHSREYGHEYVRDEIHFYHTSLIEEACMLLKESKLKIDAVIMTPENHASDILEIKEFARQKALPFFIYTPLFDQEMKDLTLKLGADEYHSGVIGQTFIKRIDFLKRIKEHKNHQDHAPDFSMYVRALPKIGRWALKRTFDLFISSIALIALSPIFLVIASILKLGSKGPVFLISKRVGLGYKIFDIYKFKSQADTGDPGACRFQKFLDDSGLDELPSLWNVLKGDMSLVGSKPLQLAEAKNLTNDQMAVRLMAPIGITGLWRIGDKLKERKAMDLDMKYALGNSFWMDMKILFFTFVTFPLNQKI